MSYESLGFIAVFLAGMASFFSPCIVPVIPAYLAYLTGIRVDKLKDGDFERKIAVSRGILFIIGFSTIFIAMGASATYIGELFFYNRELFMRIGGVVVFIAGLYLAGLLPLSMLLKERRITYIPTKIGIFTPFLLGMAFAFGWTPCVGPILSSVLVYAASGQTVGFGIILLGVYSLGLSIPFLITALAVDTAIPLLKSISRYLPWISRASGLILIILGILLYFNKLAVLTF